MGFWRKRKEEKTTLPEKVETASVGEVGLTELMFRVAVRKPRDENRIFEDSMRELDLMPSFAEEVFYSLPFRDKQPDGRVKIKKIEGLSIKAANSLGRRWGNCRVGVLIQSEDEDGYDLQGYALDLETNELKNRPHRVSKWLRLRDGRVIRLDEKTVLRELQAGVSKARRNIVLDMLPAYLTRAYFDKARGIVAGGDLKAPADPKKVTDAIASFGKHRISEKQLEGYVGRPKEAWTGGDIADLRGLWNGLMDDQVTIAEAFGPGEKSPSGPGPTGVVTAAAFINEEPTVKSPDSEERCAHGKPMSEYCQACSLEADRQADARR
jgi:hypothetical protein